MVHHKSFNITSLSKTSSINAKLTHPVLSFYSLLRTQVHENKEEEKHTRFTDLPNLITGRNLYSNVLNWCLFVFLFTDVRALVEGSTRWGCRCQVVEKLLKCVMINYRKPM